MSFNGLLTHFFLAWNSIPLSVCTQVVHFLLKDILVASKFWQLWIVSVNIHMKAFMHRHKFSIPLDTYQQAWLLDLMVRAWFIMEETAKLFSKVTVPFCIPTSKVWECLLLHRGDVSVHDFDLSNKYIVKSHCFNLHFPNDIWCGAAFHKCICHLCVFLGNVSVQICGLFLNYVICLLVEF